MAEVLFITPDKNDPTAYYRVQVLHTTYSEEAATG